MGGGGFVSCFYYVHLCMSSLCGEQCMSIAVGSVWWRGHWTMKGVVSGGSQCGGTVVAWENEGARRHYICRSREYVCVQCL